MKLTKTYDFCQNGSVVYICQEIALLKFFLFTMLSMRTILCCLFLADDSPKCQIKMGQTQIIFIIGTYYDDSCKSRHIKNLLRNVAEFSTIAFIMIPYSI